MTLNVVQWNLRSFRSQRPYLQSLVDTTHPTIICLQETNLFPSHTLSLSRFQPAVRYDRADRSGGGVAILVHQSLAHTPCNLNSPLEVIATSVALPHRDITICCIYLPPALALQPLLQGLRDLLPQLPRPFILTIDANAHHPLWGSPTSDSRGDALTQWLDDESLFLHNTGEPTYLSHQGMLTHIDLTLSTPDIAPAFTWKPLPDTYCSDHFPLLLASSRGPAPEPGPSRWRLGAADWPKYRQLLAIPNEEDYLSPTQACGVVTAALHSAAEQAVPVSRSHPKRKSAYWWTPDCTAARKEQRRALSRYRNHPGDVALWTAFKRARARFRYVTLEAQRSSWREFLSNFSSSSTSADLWNHLRKLRQGPAAARTTILREGNVTLSDPAAVADSFAQHFSRRSCGISPDPLFMAHKAAAETFPVSFPSDNSASYNRPFTLPELQGALSSSTSRSPGPDSLPYAFLHNLSTLQLSTLLAFYNYLYSTGYPHQWREGRIIPILKPDKPAFLRSSYRPITLTNCLSKIYGKLVNTRLQHFLETSHFYAPYQSGFRACHSTLDALSRLEHDARDALLTRRYCVAVFLDISQAFDTVWHHGLLLKLFSLGLSGNLARTIQQFLLSRRITVRVSGEVSPTYPLSAGVPQGSVLSPTLFTILINDLFASVPDQVRTSLYADDGALWIVHDDLIPALNLMQAALDTVGSWSHTWGLTMSPAKTSALIFTRRHYDSPPSLHLLDASIAYVPRVRFLGVWYDARLTWRPHIDRLRARCQRDLQLLRVVSYSRHSSDAPTLLKLYRALILPKLDYGSFLYHTAAPSNLLLLDRIQYAAIRTALGVLRCTPACRLEAEADLLPLSFRRRQLLVQYGCRVGSLRGHPVRNFLLTYFPIQDHLANTYALSALSRLYDEFRFLNFHPSALPPINMATHYRFLPLPVLASLHTHTKDSLGPPQWRAAFLDLVHGAYPSRTAIYTDGSLSDSGCGCGAWSSSFRIIARLPEHTTIFTAELYALYIAVKYVSSHPGRYIIFTDSLSSVRALQSHSRSPHYLVSWLSDSLLSLPEHSVVIEWVPSHMGIHGNECADTLARHSLALRHYTNIPLSSSEIHHRIKSGYRAAWQSQWSSLNPALTAFKPVLGPPAFADQPRNLQVPLTRLRVGVTNATHQHYFRREPPPECSTCHEPITLQHLLIDCPSVLQHRRPLQHLCNQLSSQFCLRTLLAPNFPTDALLQFLRDSGLLQRI